MARKYTERSRKAWIARLNRREVCRCEGWLLGSAIAQEMKILVWRASSSSIFSFIIVDHCGERGQPLSLEMALNSQLVRIQGLAKRPPTAKDNSRNFRYRNRLTSHSLSELAVPYPLRASLNFGCVPQPIRLSLSHLLCVMY